MPSLARTRFRWLKVTATAAAWLCAAPAVAETSGGQDMTELSLEQLLSVELVSVSKRPQKLIDTPAAVFVITQEDIRRSGHTSVPELLRMVPGLTMGRPTPKSWSIGIRGDEFQFSRMLLVLLDGRALYTNAFNGTFWDEFDVPLDDIDRIEVIRGPGASVWGANAVHGVINIIRKTPEQSGNYANALVGNEDRAIASLGYAGALGDLHYRVSGHYVNRDSFRARDNSIEQHDDYRNGFTSGAFDMPLTPQDKLVVQGDMYRGDRGGQFRQDLDTTGIAPLRRFDTLPVRGGNGMVRIEHTHSPTATSEFQTYIDYRFRDLLTVKDNRVNYDFEFRNRFKPSTAQIFNWGFGTRHVRENIDNTLNFIATPEQKDQAIHNIFLQDELELAEGAVHLILGSKFERNTYTGWEVQPTARALWHVADRQQVWAAVSRAVRIPSRLDRGEYRVIAGYVFNMPVQFQGTRDFGSEVVVEYDLGYRFQPTPQLHLDLTAFSQRTDNFEVFTPANPPSVLSQLLVDSANRRSLGGEALVQWQPQDWWRLTLGYSHVDIHSTKRFYSPSGTKSAPEHQVSLTSTLDLPHNFSLDLFVLYHGKMLERFDAVFGDKFNAYTRHDARLAWRPTEQLEFSLVGQNLLDRLHREGVDFFEGASFTTGQPQSAVERSVYFAVHCSY